jgi:hypothetical protein
MLPLLPFHILAAQRGDGLRPELLALFARNARSDTGLSARIEIENIAPDDNRGELMRFKAEETSSSQHGAPDLGQ